MKKTATTRSGRAALTAATLLGLTAGGLALAAPASAVEPTNLVTGPLAGVSYYATLDGAYGTYSGAAQLSDAVASGAAPIWTYPAAGGFGPISSDGVCLTGPAGGKAGPVTAEPCDDNAPGQLWYGASPGALTLRAGSAKGPMLRISGSALVTNTSSGTVWETGAKLAVPVVAAPVLTGPTSGATITPGTVFTGTGTAGQVVTITDAQGTALGTATVDEQGTWSTTLSPVPGNGSVDLTFSFAGTDGAPTRFADGSYGMTGSTKAFEVVGPDLSASTSIPNGTVFTGRGEPGATVTLTDKDGKTVGETIVDESGEWSTPISGLPEGRNHLTATATIPGGAAAVIDLGPIVSVLADEGSPVMDPAIAGGAALVLLAAAGTAVSVRRRRTASGAA